MFKSTSAILLLATFVVVSSRSEPKTGADPTILDCKPLQDGKFCWWTMGGEWKHHGDYIESTSATAELSSKPIDASKPFCLTVTYQIGNNGQFEVVSESPLRVTLVRDNVQSSQTQTKMFTIVDNPITYFTINTRGQVFVHEVSTKTGGC